MKYTIGFLVLFFFSLNAYCQQKISVLFVGNSLTYANNLPDILKAIATADSIQLDYKMLALPNYALIDHWNDGEVITEIKSEKYDFVVVQQGPSSQQEGRTMLINDGLKFAKLCAENNATLAFYTVWPSKARSFDFPGVIESYRLAAEQCNSLVCPAGKAWLEVLTNYPTVKLYGEDNFHPNYNGSVLAALVIYGRLLEKKQLSFLPYSALKNHSLTKGDFKILVTSAQNVLHE